MYKTKVLIISTRKELSIKYKKLIETLNQDVVLADNLSSALLILQKQEIEFIIISDTIKEKLSEFIKKIRVLTFNSRPIILAISKSSDLKDKLETLEAGSDDFLGEEISKQEFQMRFKAHLRRYIETFLNSITRLPDRQLTLKSIKKSFESKFEDAYILIKIKGIDLYRKLHGQIAYEKVLQTLSAIIASTLSKKDFVGHINDNEFILITNSSQAEKIASFLTFAFDNILFKFYSDDEFENNFSIESCDNKEEIKQYLMRLNVSSIEKQENIKDTQQILNSLFELVKLCDTKSQSSYIIDRIRLSGITQEKIKNSVLILEPDSALSYLLKNICLINNIQALIAKNQQEFLNIYNENKPNLVILDWGNKNSNSLELTRKISKDNIKIIFTSSILNKKEILKAGADLYVPKPYEINDMLDFIKKFLDE